MAEHRDLVIVGAGWQGIAAAKIYRDLYPNGNLLILDANSTIGGCWATENLHPKLKTQNTLGSIEYSWYPLTAEEFGVEPDQQVPGEVVHRYLQRVAEQFDLVSRIHFRVRVISAELDRSGGWVLETECPTGVQTISTKKLIVATGVTSTPRIPEIAGSKEFKGPLIGYRDLSDSKKTALIEDSSVETVTVIGGSKAAHDAVYWSAGAGKKVNWVVNNSGSGIAWMTAASTRFLGQELQVERLATTRVFSFFSPCVWGEVDGYHWPRWLLHQTKLGRSIVRLFWRVLGTSILTSTGLHLDGETEKARPDFDFQWQASSAGTLN